MNKILLLLRLIIFSCTNKKYKCDCYDWNEETKQTIITYEEGKILNNNVEPQVYCDAISTETKWCFVNDN